MQSLIEHTLRLYERYAVEVVEALNLCPWAKRARESGQVARRVLLDQTPELDPVLTIASELAADPELEVALLMFPRLNLARADFEAFTARVIELDAERYRETSPPFAFAAFHPDASADSSKPERLVPYWRRSPDPTLQLVRVSALERVRRGDIPGTQYMDPSRIDFSIFAKSSSSEPAKPELSLRQRIATANLATYENRGPSRIERVLLSIAADRRQVHDELGLPISCWELGAP